MKKRSYFLHCFFALFLAGMLSTQLISGADTKESDNRPGQSGEELYLAACAACHGSRGDGAPRSRVGFDTALPDFTECSFATREPNFDWMAIAHDGGPVRGFSNLMPAFGEALKDEELALILDHMRAFCRDKAWPRGELNLPRPLVTEKAYPEDEAVIEVGIQTEGPASVINGFVFEKRLGARSQFELLVPFGWNQQDISDESYSWIGGVGDIAVGGKHTLLHSLDHGSILSLTAELILPTGDSAKGFGKGTAIIEPFVSFGQILPADLFVQSQAGAEFPLDTDRSGREGFWRVVLGRSFESERFGRTWSPMVELLGARELVAGEKSSWDVLPQIQVTLSKRQHVMMNFGIRIPLTDFRARETEILFYLLWDWYDGAFFEGW